MSVHGGVPGLKESGPWGWGGVPGPEGCVVETATAAGGTHPTGMHSCFL